MQSVARAHASLAPGRLEVAWGELLEANINRSPSSYLENPEEERARYKHDIDKEMSLLKVLDAAENSRQAMKNLPDHTILVENCSFIPARSRFCRKLAAVAAGQLLLYDRELMIRAAFFWKVLKLQDSLAQSPKQLPA